MANASSMDTSFVHLSSHPTMEDHEANKLSRRNLQSPVELEPDEYSPVPRSASDGDGLHVVVTAGPVHRESHTRSLVKGLTWRVLATTTTTVIAWIVIGQVDTALQIGFFEFFAKLAIYYAHERAWTYVRL